MKDKDHGKVLDGIIIFGGALIVIALVLFLISPDNALGEVLKQVAATLLTTAILTIAWERILRKRTAQEIYSLTNLSHEITSGGIDKFTRDYKEVPWKDLFQQADYLRVFLLYGNTWRATHDSAIRNLIEKKKSVTVILPDPDNNELMTSLCERFDTMTSEQLKSKIVEAAEEFAKIKGVDIHVINRSPLFTAYDFGNSSVITLYSHRRQRANVPTFTLTDGSMHEFVHEEFSVLLSQSRSWPIDI